MPSLRFLPACRALLPGLLGLLCGSAASAQILRCIDPDSGSVTYTNEASCMAHEVPAPVRPAPLPEGLTAPGGAATPACQQAKKRLNAILLEPRPDPATWGARSQAAQQQVDSACAMPLAAQDKP